MFLLLFTDKFLSLNKRLPSIHKFFMFSAIIFLIFAILIYLDIPYSSGLSNIYASLFFAVLIFAVVKVFLQGYARAKYYLVGLLIYASLMALMIATFNTFLDYSTFTRHAFLAGSLIEIIFFTLILTSKYRSINMEKIRIQKELIEEQNKNEDFLTLEITKRTKEIELQNKKFETIYNTSQNGLAILDINTTKFLEVNKAYIEITGYSHHELLEKTCLDMTVSNDLAQSKIILEKVKEFGTFVDFEKECIKKDGTTFHISMSTAILEDKKTMLVSIKDITKHKQLVQNLEVYQAKLENLASTDSMTQLYNRRYLLEMAKPLFDLTKRNSTSMATVILDIDKFKNVNDTYGHDIGDKVIISLAQTLVQESRHSDIVCRWGGEEFVMLLPDTNIDGAVIISEKIRKIVQELVLNFENNQQLNFTVSIGISQVETNKDDNVEASIARADKALYIAKESGRNKVCKL